MEANNLTPIQIALLAMAHEAHAAHPPVSGQRDPRDCVAVWGSWEKAARALARLVPRVLASLGTERGTRELEWRTLRGRHRRGKEGRLVHLYRLTLRTVPLAARCAWAVQHKSKDHQHATWADVPDEVPVSAWPNGRRCSACGCTTDKPCSIDLPRCVPAGVYGSEWCTACHLRAAA